MVAELAISSSLWNNPWAMNPIFEPICFPVSRLYSGVFSESPAYLSHLPYAYDQINLAP